MVEILFERKGYISICRDCPNLDDKRCPVTRIEALLPGVQIRIGVLSCEFYKQLIPMKRVGLIE